MDLSRPLEFLRTNGRAVLATTRRDGSPQMSPILAAVDGAGRLLISSRETAIKTKNLRRDPRAWLCAISGGFFGEWYQISGDVEIISLPEAMDLLVEYYRTLSGEHPDWEEYREAMRREQRCVIRVTPTHAGPNVSG
jgi:PPOX class probable F420-dependent enzyme